MSYGCGLCATPARKRAATMPLKAAVSAWTTFHRSRGRLRRGFAGARICTLGDWFLPSRTLPYLWATDADMLGHGPRHIEFLRALGLVCEVSAARGSLLLKNTFLSRFLAHDNDKSRTECFGRR